MAELPTLHYIEYHLTEHCNFDCTGCGHFSPFAAEGFADPIAFEHDIAKLAQLFSNIRKICLLGGEPLLHPEPEAFIRIARRHFPATDLRIVTNGILLKKIGDSFWDACREARVSLDISLYPPLRKSHEAFDGLCAAHGVNCVVRPVDEFLVGINARGDSNPEEAMKYCRSHFYCPFLQDSRLHVCAMPAMVHYYNNHFDRKISDDAGIDIFADGITGEKIIAMLEKPVATCSFCSCKYKPVKWRHARAENHVTGDYEV